MHASSTKWHLIDYSLIRKRDARDFAIVRVTRGVVCWADIKLLRATVNFVVKPKVRANNDKLPKRFDINKLKITSVQNEFASEINGLSCDGSWKSFNERVFEVCSNILDFAVKKHQNWFDDNYEEINLILEEKRKAFDMLQNVDMSTNRTVATCFKAVKATVQRKLKMMQENWWNDRCDEIQEASNANNSKHFYSPLKKVYGPASSTVAPLRSTSYDIYIIACMYTITRCLALESLVTNRITYNRQSFNQSLTLRCRRNNIFTPNTSYVAEKVFSASR
uniref:Uncharacterized protein n=1 Tax=Octopus bimaculoides TaxID=37653 RepID=A0A0L8I0P5_OCTBM